MLTYFSCLSLSRETRMGGKGALSMRRLFTTFSEQRVGGSLGTRDTFLRGAPILLRGVTYTREFQGYAMKNFIGRVLSDRTRRFTTIAVKLSSKAACVSFHKASSAVIK